MRGTAIVLVLLLCTPRLARAQLRVWIPEHVAWPLVDFVISGDSTYGIQVMMSPNLQSTQGLRGSEDIYLTLAPPTARRWIREAMPVIDSVAHEKPDHRRPFSLPWLDALGGKMEMSVGLLGHDPRKQPFRFLIADPSHPKAGLSVTASAGQLRELFRAIDGVAQKSALQAIDASEHFLCELDVPPHILHREALLYPMGERIGGRQGRVLAWFVIDSTGAVPPTSFRPIVSDGPDFTAAARKAIVGSTWSPGRFHGRAVSVFVEQWIDFRLRQ